jgi:cell wall-associated NlpC family hydrolase
MRFRRPMAMLHRVPARTRTVRGLIVLAVVAVPLALLPSAGQAAPTLTIAQAQQQLAALQTKQDAAVEAYNTGTLAVTAAKRSASTAALSVAHQQVKVAAAQAQLAGLARVAYMSGGIDPITGLLDGQGAADVIERVGNLDQIARARTAQTTALQAQQTQLSALQKVSHDRLADATAAQAALNAARKSVQQLVTAQQSVLDHLQAAARAQLLAQEAQQRAAAAKEASLARQQVATIVQASYGNAPVATASAGQNNFTTQAPTAPVASSNVVGAVLSAAYSQQGKPYSYGGAGPNAYDCSGLVMWAFAHAGISLPHSAAGQYGYGTHVSESQLQPGDIVFFNEGGGIGHDGIYVGGGNMIDANHTGGWVGVRAMGYYSGFVGGTRL